MSAELIEELRARTFSRWESDIQAVMDYEDELCTRAADRIAALEAENARLVKALAFADEQSAKIEAMLEPHITWECAGCDKPATVHFERGGVGSDYCYECYMRIQERPAARALLPRQDRLSGKEGE